MAAGVVVALASRCPAGAGLDGLRVPRRRRDVGPRRRDPGRHAVRDQGAGRAGAGPGRRAVARAMRCSRTLLGRPRIARAARLTGHAPRDADHRPHRDPVGRHGVRLGRGDRDPRRSHRVRRLGGLPRDPRRPVHAADPPGTRPGRDPRADRRAPPPRPGRDRDAPGRPRPTRRRSTTGWLGSAPRTRPSRPTPGSRATAGTAIDGAAGRPPTSSRPSRPAVVPRCGRTTTTPCGPATRRSPRPTSAPTTRRAASSVARPTGRRRACCTRRPRGSSRSTSRRRPRTTSPRPSSRSGRSSCRSGVVACHDPGGVAPDPDLTYSFPVYARLAEAGRLPLRVHACLRDDALSRRPSSGATEAARRSAATRRPGEGRLAEVLRRRLARVADGRAPGRHRARARPAAPARPPPRRLDDRARRARRARRAGVRRRHRDARSTRSATPRSGPRSTSSRRARRPRR